MKINADENVNNQLKKEYGIKDLLRILIIVSANVINHAA